MKKFGIEVEEKEEEKTRGRRRNQFGQKVVFLPNLKIGCAPDQLYSHGCTIQTIFFLSFSLDKIEFHRRLQLVLRGSPAKHACDNIWTYSFQLSLLCSVCPQFGPKNQCILFMHSYKYVLVISCSNTNLSKLAWLRGQSPGHHNL